MGEVYRATDTKLGRAVALKVLPPEMASMPERLERFRREAKALAALDHPGIVTVYSVEEADGVHFLTMQLVEGEPLDRVIPEGGLPLDRILDIAAALAEALTAAHEKGIVHRDLKPANVMVAKDGRVKVLDFGLARMSATDQEASGDSELPTYLRTREGVVMGTVPYMSPEQVSGREVDHRTDIFSLGIVLYEMTSGLRPFKGNSSAELASAILRDTPRPLGELRGGLPESLQRAIDRCLQKSASDRFPSARELREALRASRGASSSKEAQTLEIESIDKQAINPQSRIGNPKSKSWSFGLLVLLLAVGGFFGYQYLSPANGKISSIAVLPFENRSSDADTDYLSDGLAESLIYRLSQIPDLKVSPPSSVFRYRGKETDPQVVAKQLEVDSVMTGRMVKRGDHLTISVELVDVRNDTTLWGEQYERKMSDLLATQREIAAEITNKLRVELSGESEQNLAKRDTDSNEAYQLYLKGRFHLNQRTNESLKRAVIFYRQAIEKDPNFALAYSGLAATYAIFPIWSVGLPKDSMPQAKAAALRALELDDSLAEAHAALGLYLHYFEFDRAGGEKEMRRAIQLNPNYATAHEWLAVDILTALKRFDEAVAEIKRAEELDPLSSVVGTNAGYTLVFARRYDEAIAQLKRVLTLDPNYAYALYTLGYAFDGKGMYAEAIVEYRRSLALNDDPFAKALLVRSLAKSGKRDEALKLVAQLKADSAQRYVSHYCLAIAYTALGEKEEALMLLEKDLAERSSFVSYSAGEPALDDLRDDPRFKALLKRMNLPE